MFYKVETLIVGELTVTTPMIIANNFLYRKISLSAYRCVVCVRCTVHISSSYKLFNAIRRCELRQNLGKIRVDEKICEQCNALSKEINDK